MQAIRPDAQLGEAAARLTRMISRETWCGAEIPRELRVRLAGVLVDLQMAILDSGTTEAEVAALATKVETVNDELEAAWLRIAEARL